MNSNLKVLKMVETEAPELLAECVNNELFKKLNMQPIPVLIQNFSEERWHGFCSGSGFTQSNEIVIAAELFDVRSSRLRGRQKEEILYTYLHECAHRLIPNAGHNASFLCMNMILQLRAGGRQIWHVKVYDVHQEKYFSEAWPWAWQLAHELYKTVDTAEKCAEIVMSKYVDWAAWMDGASERDEEAELNKQLAINKQKKEARDVNNQIKSLKQDRWNFAFAAMVITTLLLTFFNK